MKDLLASPILHGALLAVALEIAWLTLRRYAPSLRLGWVCHPWAVGVGLVVALSHLPGVAGHVGWQVLALVVLALTTIVVFGLIDALLLARPWTLAGPPLLPKLARDVLRIALVLVVTISAAVKLFNLELPAVLVSSTLLSAAVGLALQDLLKNAFAGIALQLHRPFEIGDWLLLGDTPAQVEEITWRSTRLRTNEGHVYHEPNAAISAARIVNLGNGKAPVAFLFKIGLSYGLPPATAREALLAGAQSAPGVEPAPQVQVFLEHYDESALTYHVRAWTRQVHAVNQFKDAVNSRIWYQLKRAGHQVPFPIRTVHLHAAERDATRERAADLARTARLLGEVPLFTSFPADVLDDFATRAERRVYDDGEALVHEGGTDTSLFVVAAGRVVISKRSETGAARIRLAVMGPGEFFGEMSLLTGAPRSATVTAEGSCEVIVLPRAALEPLLTSDPRAAEVLSRALADRSTEQSSSVDTDRRIREAARGEMSPASLLARIRSLFKLS